MLRKNKRGNILVLFLTITSIIVFTMLFVSLYTKEKKMTAGIGSEQLKILRAYQKGEKTLLYIDLSARYSAYSSVIELSEKGGILYSECGSYNGVRYWSKIEGNAQKECYPKIDEINENFKNIFEKNLNSYFSAYTDVIMPSARDYDFYLSEDANKIELVGKAHNKLAIALQALEAAELGTALSWPVSENSDGSLNVDSCFGPRNFAGSLMHHGIDIAERAGEPVFAVADGKIIGYSDKCTEVCVYDESKGGWQKECNCGDYGNYVLIQHNGFQTRYAHLSKVIKKNGEVKRGDIIGKVGSTGHSTGSHLHFEVILNGVPVNSMCFYDSSNPKFKFDESDGSCKNPERECKNVKPIATASQSTAAIPVPVPVTPALPKEVPPIEEDYSGVSYSINPSFRQTITYDFSAYLNTVEKAKQIVASCSGKSFFERDDCINNLVSGFSDAELGWKFSKVESVKALSEPFFDYIAKCSSSDSDCYCLSDENVFPGGTNEIAINGDNVGISESFTGDQPEFMQVQLTLKAEYDKEGNLEKAYLEFERNGIMETWNADDVRIYIYSGKIMFVKKDVFENVDNKFSNRKCNPLPSEYNFIVTDKKHSVPYYDATAKKFEYKNPEIIFALEIG